MGEVSQFVMMATVLTHSDKGEAVVISEVLGGEYLASSDLEIFGTFDAAFDFDANHCSVSGLAADVEAGVVVRHLMRMAAERTLGGHDGLNGATIDLRGIPGVNSRWLGSTSSEAIDQSLRQDEGKAFNTWRMRDELA